MADQFNKNNQEINSAEHLSPLKTGDNIEAKRVAGYVWDAQSSEWVRMTQPSITTGDVTVEGTSSYSDSGGIERRGLVDGDRHVQVDVLSSTLPTGAATSANQSTLIGHVDGIETLLTSIDGDTAALAGAVDGSELQVDVVSGVQTDALTDAELRANPVPVSGTVSTGLSQPLTDTQLRATAVPVSGTVTANLGAVDNAVLDDIAANQTDSSQKTQIVDASGNAVTVTGNKLDVNASVSTTGLATDTEQEAQTALLTAIESNQLPDGHNVTIDNASIAVTGTVTANTGLSQPLTDTQLRATAVPVSGTVTANLSAVDNAVLDQIELNQDAQTALLTTIESNQLPDGHNVTIDNPGDIGGGTQYDEGDIDATPTGTVAMWRDSADDSIVSVSDENPLPVSASIDTTGLATDTEQEVQTDHLAAIEAAVEAIEAAQLPDGHNVTVDNASIAVTGTFWQATQPVSGTVTANLGTLNGAATAANQQTDALTDTELRATPVVVDLGANNDVTVTSGTITANLGAVDNAVLDQIEANQDAQTSLLTTIEGNQLPDGHNVTIDNASIAVTGTFWQATQPVSGTVTANLGTLNGAATTAKQDDIIAAIEGVGGLVPEAYDEIALTYVAAGDGAGEIETVVYKLATVTVATLTLGYDANDRLDSVVRS